MASISSARTLFALASGVQTVGASSSVFWQETKVNAAVNTTAKFNAIFVFILM
jgi:hypothetical protein